jgi:uncharacterized OB-fold protein
MHITWGYFWRIRAIHLMYTTCASPTPRVHPPHHPDPHRFASSRVQRAGKMRVGIKVAPKGVACSRVATTTCTKHGMVHVPPAQLDFVLQARGGGRRWRRTVCYAAQLA